MGFYYVWLKRGSFGRLLRVVKKRQYRVAKSVVKRRPFWVVISVVKNSQPWVVISVVKKKALSGGY